MTEEAKEAEGGVCAEAGDDNFGGWRLGRQRIGGRRIGGGDLGDGVSGGGDGEEGTAISGRRWSGGTSDSRGGGVSGVGIWRVAIRGATMEIRVRQFRGGDGDEGPAVREAATQRAANRGPAIQEAAFRGAAIRRVAIRGAAMERRERRWRGSDFWRRGLGMAIVVGGGETDGLLV